MVVSPLAKKELALSLVLVVVIPASLNAILDAEFEVSGVSVISKAKW